MILYSFIIPHKNSLKLLQRCLDTIPIRDDIEIIVVDDNSTSDNRPVISREDEKIIYIDAEHSKGAGHARNRGMKEATGKWLLFADCDDFYAQGFISELDRFSNSNYDIVYFDSYIYYNIDTHKYENRPYSDYLRKFLKDPGKKINVNNIKYGENAAWNKMFSHQYIKSLGISFEEIPKGNDIYFTHSAGYHTDNVAAIAKKLYFYVKNPQSITWGKMDKRLLLESISQYDKSMRFVRMDNAWNLYPPFHQSMLRIFSMYGPAFWAKYYFNKAFAYTPIWTVIYQKLRFSLKKVLFGDI